MNNASFCELRELGGCAGGLQRHHVLNRGKLRNIPGAMKYIEKHSEILLADICAAHNTSRIADLKKARALLLQARVDLWGQDYVEGVLDGLRAATKTGTPEWKLSALLAPLDHEV